MMSKFNLYINLLIFTGYDFYIFLYAEAQCFTKTHKIKYYLSINWLRHAFSI